MNSMLRRLALALRRLTSLTFDLADGSGGFMPNTSSDGDRSSPYAVLVIALLLLAPAACNAPDHPDATTASDFGTYARALFTELDRTPIGDSLALELGLFGDLNVMAGEHVVMGRYRFRVDTTNGTRSASLTFLARSPSYPTAVPVLLEFERNDGWMLREASLVSSENQDGMNAELEDLMRPHLDAWVRRAQANVSS